jgi:CheY-like chemotaxis protein
MTTTEPTTATLLIALGIGLGSAVHPVFFLGALGRNRNELSEQEMRGNWQLLPSTNSFLDKTWSMKTPVMLLLTTDNELEELVADALSEIGGISHLTRAAGDALETICGVADLDLAIIDFEHGPHGMTLLSAISTLREDVPVIVITRDDEEQIEALAYANGATACLSKQAVAAQLAKAIRQLCTSGLENVFA